MQMAVDQPQVFNDLIFKKLFIKVVSRELIANHE